MVEENFLSLYVMYSEDINIPFKKAIYKSSSLQYKIQNISNFNKKKIWRSLKQILSQEKALPWSTKAIHYTSINTSASLKPLKKYSDISGLQAYYTDPQTKLFYTSKSEYGTIQSLPMDIAGGYLSLRGASSFI